MLTRRPFAGLLLLRIVIGVVFIAHGYQKLQAIDAVAGFFHSIGIMPLLAYVVSWAEILGGLALILGIMTTAVSYILAVIIIGAIALVKAKYGLIGGYELELVLFAGAMTIGLSGPGAYTVKRGLKRKLCDCCEICRNGCTRHEQ